MILRSRSSELELIVEYVFFAVSYAASMSVGLQSAKQILKLLACCYFSR